MPSVESQARKRVRNELGTALEGKASDAFCVSFGRTSPVMAAAALETGGAPPQTLRAVVEFAPVEPEQNGLGGEMERVKGTPEWESLRQAVQGLAATMPGQEHLLRGAAFLRQARTTALREQFYRMAGPVRDELERTSNGLFALRPEAITAGGLPTSITQVCWLNESLRTWTDPRALALVAEDARVSQVDIPRRIEGELRTTGGTVGAVAYRDATGRMGTGVIVAVIDSEVARDHAAFQERVIHKENFTHEPWGSPGAHGTAVAGIVGSRGSDFAGMAPEVTIYNYKVLATNPFMNADDFGGALAIQRALEDGAQIANCSWGAGPAGDGTSREARACDRAWALGLTIVKSAGNKGPGKSTLTTPADAEGVIVVGATDQNGKKVQGYSSRGPTAHGKARPHLVAPGGTTARGIDSCLVGGTFGDVAHGTSYAAPHVTGLLALLLQDDPDLTPDEQRVRLLGLCSALDSADGNTQGSGLLSLLGTIG